MALQTTDIARQWLSSNYVGTPTDTNTTMAQQHMNDVFYTARAKML
jgi:hypothetical protein